MDLIRKVQEQDWTAIEDLVKQAFATASYSDGTEAALVARLRQGPAFLFCQRQQRQAARGERTSGKREDQPETSAQTDRRKFAEKIYHGRMLPPYSR